MVLTFSSSLSMIHSTYTCTTTALLVPLFPSIPSSLASSYAPRESPAILLILLISLRSTDSSSIIEMVIQYDSPCLPDPPLAKVADLLPHLNHLEITSGCPQPHHMHILSCPPDLLYHPTPPTTRVPAVPSLIASQTQMI